MCYFLTNILFPILDFGEVVKYYDFIENLSDGSKRAKCTICQSVYYDRGTTRKHVKRVHFNDRK